MKYMVLYDGYTVTAEFYHTVQHQVEEIIPAMEPGVKYTLEMLCGQAFWLPLSDGKRRWPADAWRRWWSAVCCRFASPRADTSIRSFIGSLNTQPEISGRAFLVNAWLLTLF